MKSLEELWSASFARAREKHRDLEVYRIDLPVSEVTTADAAKLLVRILLK
jgi:hypothetical protein